MTLSFEAQDIDLTKEQRKALYEALVDAFAVDELDQLVYLDLGESLDQIAMGASGLAIMSKFVQWLERRGRVAQFVELAYRARSRNAKMQAIAKELGFVADAPPKARLEQMLQQFALEFDMAPDLPQDRKFERMLEAFARELNLRPTPQVDSQTAQSRLIPGQFADLSLMLRWLSTAAQRVCRIESQGKPGGTGFLVGRDCVLTTFSAVEPWKQEETVHCDCRFDYIQQEKGLNQGELIRLSAKQALIDFSPYSLSALPGSKDAALPDRTELDYALLRLADAVGETRGWYSLANVVPARENAMIYLVHHPLGEPLKLSHPPGKLHRLNENGTRYEYIDAKTSGGSGGAPCFDEHGNLIAMHHARDRRVFRPDGLGIAIPVTAIHNLLVERGVELA